MSQIPLANSIAQMNKLYVTYRKTFLEQFKTGYITKKVTLTDYWLEQHLTEKRTIGVKLGSQGLTKFMTFDVDYRDNLPKAKEVTEQIVKFLRGYYGIDLKDIHIHFSGGKGYHVSLFFDETIQDKSLKLFYREVLMKLELKENEVEFRASSQYGVKLPLSIHRQTGNFMHYCMYDPKSEMLFNLNKEESFEYFLNIAQQSARDFKELILDELDSVENPRVATLKEKDAEEFQDLRDEINVDGQTLDELRSSLVEVLNQGTLLYPSTRDIVTFRLMMLFKEQGYEREEALELVSTVLINTYDNPETRVLISRTTTREYMLSEAERLSHSVYEKYNLSQRRKDIEVSKEEILEILSVGKWQHKKLLFSMLIHSKRYQDKNGEFYMSYSQIRKYGNNNNGKVIAKYLTELDENKKILIVSRGKLDTIRTKALKQPVNETNVYKVTMKSSAIESNEIITINSDSNMTLEEVTQMLVKDKREVQSLLSRRQWENHFRDLYVS